MMREKPKTIVFGGKWARVHSRNAYGKPSGSGHPVKFQTSFRIHPAHFCGQTILVNISPQNANRSAYWRYGIGFAP